MNHTAPSEHLLLDALLAYARSDVYPLHMPGHKRRCVPAPDLPFAWDVTEVPGTDDLHEAEGILAEAMARTAALFGAKRTWYLVNGSTCGLLAGIRALAPAGSTIIAARNCHKAVYHAIELGGLRVRWLTPPVVEGFGVYGSVSPAAVAAALDETPNAACVVLTSPTYEGVVSDIAAIAAACHRRRVPLLIDEAHGAHLGPFYAAQPFPEALFPAGALACGADVVIQSAHKTLPSLTQTALLHLGYGAATPPAHLHADAAADSRPADTAPPACAVPAPCMRTTAVLPPLVSPEALERQLDIFETSSPSYPLLVSLDGCTGILNARGGALFAAWGSRLARFDAAIRPLHALHVFCHAADSVEDHPEVFAHDAGKILVSGRGTPYSGPALAEVLRTRFGLETEMSCGENVLAMTSPCDDDTALCRLADALLTLDAELCGSEAAADGKVLPHSVSANAPHFGPGGAPQPAAPVMCPVSAPSLLPAPGRAVCTIAEALAQPSKEISPENAVGRTAAEYIWAYPPGVPLLAPGEQVTAEFLASARLLESCGTRLHHSGAKSGGILCLLG